MASTPTERQAAWRRRVALKTSIFDDLNAERAARIRQAFPGDERPEVRAVVEFFANYPRCQNAPTHIYVNNGAWQAVIDSGNSFDAAAAHVALTEISSLPVVVTSIGVGVTQALLDQVCDEVAKMRALGLWGRS